MITPRSKGGKIQRLIELHLAQQESYVLDRYRQQYLANYDRQRLRQELGIEDSELTNRLYLAGFRSENVMALNAFPVAMTAWASGTTTLDERKTAEAVLLESDIGTSDAANELFRRWLQEQPPSEWWQLWEEFLAARAEGVPPSKMRELSRVILTACRKVAMASGGIWGLGKISPAEQRVLARTERAFRRFF